MLRDLFVLNLMGYFDTHEVWQQEIRSRTKSWQQQSRSQHLVTYFTLDVSIQVHRFSFLWHTLIATGLCTFRKCRHLLWQIQLSERLGRRCKCNSTSWRCMRGVRKTSEYTEHIRWPASTVEIYLIVILSRSFWTGHLLKRKDTLFECYFNAFISFMLIKGIRFVLSTVID